MYTVKTIRMAPYIVACSMQYVSTVLTYPGSSKTSSVYHIPVFGGKIFLIFPIIYLAVDLKLFCIIGLSDLINSDLCQYLPWMTQLLTLGASFPVSWSVGQLALKFHWVKMYWQYQHANYIEITQSVMPKSVYLLTV